VHRTPLDGRTGLEAYTYSKMTRPSLAQAMLSASFNGSGVPSDKAEIKLEVLAILELDNK
jgi:hypothetical protein